jgi:preprotein translocase subunit SecA
MLGLVKNLFDNTARTLRRMERVVDQINALEPAISSLSDRDLAAKTDEFRRRHASGETLDQLLPEAFAVVREAGSRRLGLWQVFDPEYDFDPTVLSPRCLEEYRSAKDALSSGGPQEQVHLSADFYRELRSYRQDPDFLQRAFDVQLIGGMVLHQGRIAEMKTGEGKTLAATLPVYLNALVGRGVHVVTVNDYLAKRDAEWMGKIYKFLGMSVGVIIHGLTTQERRSAYSSDITYGTNNEFGFDYLRDNMVVDPQELVQRELHYAIVDEVDSILIDEARTPLIISGRAEKSTGLYQRFAALVPMLKRDADYTVDEKARTVAVTEEGVEKVERLLGVENLYDPANIELTHHLQEALKAHALMKRDRDYIVKDGQVIIVDEFTGRLMFGRRYSGGLHQAIEAKERVRVEDENQTLASITFQNYFRMYEKLAGMTGTAKTEEEEFRKIYGMDVVVIPTNRPMIRIDHPDVVYKTKRAKFDAIVREIEQLHSEGRPILVGTIAIETSEMLSEMLRKRGIAHQVLNAKYHEKEAEIIKGAGQFGAVTIATNMAGRGTDIRLGKGVADLGGLHVLGTERHESRRIDNQLRGRSGRQGDAGSSRFYVSLEDDLMRLFGGETINGLMERLGWEEDQPIEHPYVSKAIERAQKRVEARNFDIRKHVLQYDDVMNQQREAIYGRRRVILHGDDVRDEVLEMMGQVCSDLVDQHIPDRTPRDEWDAESLKDSLWSVLGVQAAPAEWLESCASTDDLKRRLESLVRDAYEKKEREIGAEQMRVLERRVMLRAIDLRWMDHMQAMDDLRDGIGLRAYAQRDPLTEYRFEAFQLFSETMAMIRRDTVSTLLRIRVVSPDELRQQTYRNVVTNDPSALAGSQLPKVRQRKVQKVGRNDPCPCGSGKKYKKCCGA